MNKEEKVELCRKLEKSFIPMRSGSSRFGYQKTPVIDEPLLQEVLEEIIDNIPIEE